MPEIRRMDISRIAEYGRIYAEAFSGAPWNDSWSVKDAMIHVKELLMSEQSYGL